MFGGGGNDTLDGGAGRDTAVYLGWRNEYRIDPQTDGSYWITNKNGSQGAGKDTLINIEFVQFDGLFGKEIINLRETRRKRIAIVLDSTGSAGSRIRDLRNPLTALVEASYADSNDTSFAVVLFKDAINGEPSVVAQSFTDQNNLENSADRKSATMSLLDSIIDKSGYGYGGNDTYFSYTPGDVFGGGGDDPETSFDGLRLALNGAGEWTVGEGTRQLFLFTDAPAKDGALANYITALAHNIGATVQTSSSLSLAGSSVNTFDLAFGANSSSVSRLVGVNEPTVNPNPTITQVQIFTIFTGSSGVDTAALEEIARDNGGAFLAGLSDDNLLRKLVEIVNNPSLNQSPIISVVANDPDATETIVGDTTNPGQFTLNRTGDLSQSLTFAYTLSGTATNGGDYQSLLETVTFAAGENTVTIDLTPLDDNLYEGSESVTLTLRDGGTKYNVDPTAQFATVTITDNDAQPTIRIASASQIEGNSGTNNYAFNVTLSNPSVGIVTVNYSTADGTATAISDYTAATGIITFNPDETSKTINLTAKGDTTLELDETFTVNLSNATGGTISQATGIGTILDDDRPIIVLTVADANAAESKKNPAQFNLTRTGTVTKALNVNYAIAGTAANSTDYQKLTGTVTFKAGSSIATIKIEPIDDKIYEGTETVTLTIDDGGTSYKFDPTAKTGTVTIADDDLPSISLSVTDNKAAETKIGQPNNPGQFTIKRTGSITDALTVNYNLNGTADNGIDYQDLGHNITFSAGSDTATIDIKPIDDNLAERTEIVLLKLAKSSKYLIDGASSRTIKIADNDRPRDRDNLDLVLDVDNLDDINPRIGTELQGASEGEVIDLRGFGEQTLKVDTATVSDAGFNNYIGFYAVEDDQGTLANGLKVSDIGYAEAAIKSAILRSFKQETRSNLGVTGGKILAPVVIANGTFEEYLQRNPKNQTNSNIHAYFNYIGANTDRVDHFRLLGDNKFGVEDSYAGGDKDYNDIIFQMTVK